MSTEQLRTLIDTLQQLDEAEAEPFEYTVNLGRGTWLRVRYISPKKLIISGDRISGGFRNDQGNESHLGKFDFNYDTETKEIEIEDRDEDEWHARFDEDLADKTARYIVNEFFNMYGRDWPTIYKNLGKPMGNYAVLKILASNFPEKKNEFMRSIRTEMRRSGATEEQMELVKLLNRADKNSWITIAKNAVEFAEIKEKWKTMPANKVGREDIQELINSMVDLLILQFIEDPRGLDWRPFWVGLRHKY